MNRLLDWITEHLTLTLSVAALVFIGGVVWLADSITLPSAALAELTTDCSCHQEALAILKVLEGIAIIAFCLMFVGGSRCKKS